MKLLGKWMCNLGDLQFLMKAIWFRRGVLIGDWFSFAQFRDNVPIASNIPEGTNTLVIQEICHMLFDVWDPEVLCDCITPETPICTGACLQLELRALGLTLIVGGGPGLSTVHPSALRGDWGVWYDPPVSLLVAVYKAVLLLHLLRVTHSMTVPVCYLGWTDSELVCLGPGGNELRLP